jgi:SAM-dependent methyltransferase
VRSPYLRVFDLFPEFLKRRIYPLEYLVQDFVASAAGRGGVVVDAGAGESRNRCWFESEPYYAFDLAIGDVDWDYSRLDVIADLERFPLGSGSARVVLNTQVLEHVPEPSRVVKELHRILVPGGELFLTAPQGWCEHQAPHDYYRFTRFALEELLRDAGFSRWRIEPLGGYFHYLGHRLTFVPKVLFQDLKGWKRIVLLPLELASLALFCFLGPLACYYLDRFDRKREFTLCYRVHAVKGQVPDDP